MNNVTLFAIDIRRVHVSLAVTCHLHFWQNGQDFSRSTAITRGWNEYRNKGQHRMLTKEKIILPPLLPGLEPSTSRARVRLSTTGLSPLPLRAFRD